MPIPKPTDITTTAGKTVAGVALDEDDLVIKFTDATFSILSVGWDQGVSEPELYQPALNLIRHGYKAVAAGLLTQQGLDNLIAEVRLQQKQELEARELKTYQRLKEKFEP